ncbi:MAG: class I SAM-dependent methyltransferase [Kordiimonadaceae bacterium]|nr:class I SAM-dependent methyltransferase [Kordiimonadaceae bacterium]
MKLRHLALGAAITVAFTSQITALDTNMAAAINSPDRPASETVRDAKRKPGEVLSFLGIKQGMHVADLLGGSGYYTDILSRVVGDDGHVVNYINYYVRGRFPDTFGKGGMLEKRQQTEQWKKNVSVKYGDMGAFSAESPLDAAIMVMFYHDTVWQGTERDKMNQAVFKALKPGGIYGILDHSSLEGAGTTGVKTLHRIEKSVVIKEIEAAGFKLVAESHLLSHPEDTRDYNVFRDYQTNRDSTDRFLLKFQKPE